MSTELHNALAEAAEAGGAEFSLRNVDAVILPATQRVRRQRASIAAAGTMGVVLLAGGLVWGMDSLTTLNAQNLDPAQQSEPPITPPGQVAEVPWSTLALAAVTEPRVIGDKRVDSAAGMICHHASPQDDPRVALESDTDPAVSSYTSIADCAPVWFKNGPLTSDTNGGWSMSSLPASLSAQTVVTNGSDRPLAIDTGSVFMWVETAPGSPTDKGLSTFSGMIIGPSMWGTDGSNTALLDSATETTVMAPGGSFVAKARATAMGGAGDALSDIIANDGTYTISFWARIHEANPKGDATYLIQLGEAHTFDVEVSD